MAFVLRGHQQVIRNKSCTKNERCDCSIRFHSFVGKNPPCLVARGSIQGRNGFLAYGGFHPSFYHSLTATQIAISLSEDKLDCSFACMAEPKCASFNIAVNPGSKGLFLCELLKTDMFHEREKLPSNASYHHYSPEGGTLSCHIFLRLFTKTYFEICCGTLWLLILYL